MSKKHLNPKKRNNFIIYGVSLTAVIITAICVTVLCLSSLRLKQNAVTIEAGTSFSPFDYLKSDSKNVDIKGKADTSVPGVYKIRFLKGKHSKTLEVTVEDTVAPVLTAVGNPIEFKCGTQFSGEELVTAKDVTVVTYTIDTNGFDLSVPGAYTVTVTGTDLGKNSSKCDVNVQMIPVDTTPPVIKGAADVTVTAGASFNPSDKVSVTDDNDNNPTLTIDESKLNLKKPGTYTVTYTATDSSGNTATVQRKITVVEAKKAEPKINSTPSFYTPSGGAFGWDATGIKNQPYLVAVNRVCCTVTVYGKDGDGNYTVPVKAMACSVGRDASNSTPTGRFTTTDRYEWRKMVDNSYGRFAIRITGSILFHSVCYVTQNDKSSLEYDEYNKLGSPASLGCVRLCLRDVKWLYDNCPRGFTTVIYDDATLSGPLGKPSSIKIDVNDTARRGWDPTDWDPQNPWNQ